MQEDKQIAAIKHYNRSAHKKTPHMHVCIEDDIDKAADTFAFQILKSLQYWHNEPQIVIHLATGNSPFIGYRKISGDNYLKQKHNCLKYNKDTSLLTIFRSASFMQ